MALPLLATLGGLAATVFDDLFPDKNESQKMQNAFILEMVKHQGKIELAASANIKAEAASQHWLAANWRPITMLVFVGLIVARMFGYTAPNISEAEYVKLWSIMELGIGGYIASRGVEKIVPKITDVLKR